MIYLTTPISGNIFIHNVFLCHVISLKKSKWMLGNTYSLFKLQHFQIERWLAKDINVKSWFVHKMFFEITIWALKLSDLAIPRMLPSSCFTPKVLHMEQVYRARILYRVCTIYVVLMYILCTTVEKAGDAQLTWVRKKQTSGVARVRAWWRLRSSFCAHY